jgi:hypothetical protein
MVAAVAQADPDGAVPTCPDWTARDLGRHLGGVHRWTTGFVEVHGDRPGGRAGDLYLALWNRAGSEHLSVAGERSVLGRFSEGVQIRWS